MSDFLEQVFAAQALEASPRRRRRKLDQGFAGRRFAVMLTVMAGLTAVPTWIMLRAGANGLEQPAAAASVQPLLVPHIDLGVPASAPPEAQSPPAVAQRVPQPPAQEQPQAAPPVLEGRSYVDTGSRPMQKRRPTKPKAPTPAQDPPAQPTPSQASVIQPPPTRAPVVPALTPPADLTPSTVKPSRTRIAERPQVIPPEPPQLKDFRARS